MSLYEIKEQKLDKLIDNLNKNINIYLDNKKYNLLTSINNLKLVSPDQLIDKNRNVLKEYKVKLNNIIDKQILTSKHKLDYVINTLKLVNPLNILSNGYSLVKVNDKVIKSSKDVKLDDLLNIKLHDGELIAKVEEIK